MQNKKEDANSRLASNMATTKYRRLQTLIKKTMELSQKCGTSMNLLVKDSKYNKITEYHTDDESMKFENIMKQINIENGNRTLPLC